MNIIVATVDQLRARAEEEIELHDGDEVEHDVDALGVGEDILAENTKEEGDGEDHTECEEDLVVILEVTDEAKNMLMLLHNLLQEELGVPLLQTSVIASDLIVMQDLATLDIH